MTLGDRLVELRKRNGLSQDALAEALGVSRQSVSKWETNASVPDLDKLVKLSALFDVSLDELVQGEKPQAEVIPLANPNKLWLQLVNLYREKAYLLGWLLVAQSMLRANSFMQGVGIYYSGIKDWDATVKFMLIALPHSLVVIFLLLLIGLLIVFAGRRFSGRFRWYHFGWIPIFWALFGLRPISVIHTGLLELLLMQINLFLLAKNGGAFLENIPFSLLEAIPLYLLLVFGFTILFIGARNSSAHKEKSSE